MTLKLAEPGDFHLYLWLKSDPTNIHWSGYTSAPDPKELREWFIKTITTGTRRIYLASAGPDVVGYVYVDLHKHHSEITYAIHTDFSGRGLAKAAVAAGLKCCPIKPVIAWIAEDHAASIKVVLANGFVFSGETISKTTARGEVLKMQKFICS